MLPGWQDEICCKLAAGSIRSKEGTAEAVLPSADEVNRWSQELNEMSRELAQSRERRIRPRKGIMVSEESLVKTGFVLTLTAPA